MFLAASPRIFDTDGSPVHIPKLTGMAAPSWHGETEQVDEVDPTWDEVTLLPSNMASVKSLTPAQQRAGSPVGHRAQAALRDRMVRDVAAKIDTALVAGDGAATAGGDVTPKGLLNYTGTQELTGVGAPTLDDLHDAEGLILAANVDPSWLLRHCRGRAPRRHPVAMPAVMVTPPTGA